MSLEFVSEAVLTGDAEAAAAETETALDAGTTAADILHKACIPAMTEVGRLFEEGEMFVPEMFIAARAMQSALEILKPQLVETGVEAVGKVVIGTVAGDLHDIGKNLVAMMLEGAGFEIIDLGTDVKPTDFVAAVREHEPDLVGMSALLTTTMTSIGKTIDALTEAGLRGKVKVIIGGAPVTQAFADQIGADGYAEGAEGAARLANSLLGLA
jgi:5-methyltetrahydrofolate--homocysteine methyltransferase